MDLDLANSHGELIISAWTKPWQKDAANQYIQDIIDIMQCLGGSCSYHLHTDTFRSESISSCLGAGDVNRQPRAHGLPDSPADWRHRSSCSSQSHVDHWNHNIPRRTTLVMVPILLFIWVSWIFLNVFWFGFLLGEWCVGCRFSMVFYGKQTVEVLVEIFGCFLKWWYPPQTPQNDHFQ